jgi:hypothetical protein
MPWHRPKGSAIPNRQGDKLDTPIYTALGKALSAWEGVNAAANSLAHALLQHLDEAERGRELEIFHKQPKTHDRVGFLRRAGEQFLTGDFGRELHDAVAKFKKDLGKELGAYTEWAARRNDIAHGYVTEAMTPDYGDPDQPIITVYALLPSHARPGRFHHEEPEWNYLASEIEVFAQRFQELDDRLERLARTVISLYPDRRPPAHYSVMV